MCETWKSGSSLDGSGDIFTSTSLRSSGCGRKAGRYPASSAGSAAGCCAAGSRRLAHRFVHLELHVALEAEQLVLARESLGAVRQQEEVAEEEGPQLPGAFAFLEAAAVQQLARPEAVGQRVKDQVLEGVILHLVSRLQQNNWEEFSLFYLRVFNLATVCGLLKQSSSIAFAERSGSRVEAVVLGSLHMNLCMCSLYL